MILRQWRSIYPSVSLSRSARAVLFATCWLFGPVLLLVFSQRDPGPLLPAVKMSDFPIPPSGIGAFSMRCLKTDRGHKPGLFISGSNLRGNNAHHGFFSTPLSKTITIDDLKAVIRFSIAPDKPSGLDAGSIASPKVAHAGLPSSCSPGTMPFCSSDTVGERGEHIHGLNQLLFELRHEVLSKFVGDGVEVSLPIDVSHAMGVVVRDLCCEFYRNDKLDLRIDCKKAILSGSVSEAVLRGCVVIRVADGTELVSNCVRWDLEQNRFTVPGRYVLNRNGALRRGRGLRCDHRLRVLGGRGPFGKEGVTTWARRMSR